VYISLSIKIACPTKNFSVFIPSINIPLVFVSFPFLHCFVCLHSLSLFTLYLTNYFIIIKYYSSVIIRSK
jgi:hypothetical protein